ncbi:MAG: right-handed parallel beta-helix repeat-containing protein [Bacteroidia bacterium]
MSRIIFKMGPNAKIINNLTVEFIGCTFEACDDYMWFGIESDADKSKIFMDECYVYDAKNAIYISRRAEAHLKNTLFQRNYIGVYAANTIMAPIAGASNVTLEHCDFRGNNGWALLPPHNQLMSSSPIVYKRSLAGCYFHNATSIIIGNPTDAGNINLFDGFVYGIYGRFSQMDVHYANFMDIAPDLPDPLPWGFEPAASSAIRLDNMNTPYFLRNEKSNITKNTINTSVTGVFAEYSDDLSVLDNTMNNVQTGIKVINDFKNPVIEDNDIAANSMGIQVLKTHAIVNQTKEVKINSNLVDDPFTGIMVMGAPFQIGSNIVKVKYTGTPAAVTGIWVANNTGNSHVTSNLVQLKGSLPMATFDAQASLFRQQNRGILIDHCSNVSVSENLIQNMVTAIFLKNHLLSTQLRCNTMEQVFVGWLRENANMSDQGGTGNPADNRWLSIRKSNARVYDLGSILSFDYFHRGTASDLNVYSIETHASNAIAFPNINEANTCTYPIFSGHPPVPPYEEEEDTESFAMVADGQRSYHNMARSSASFNEHFDELNTLKFLEHRDSLQNSRTFQAFWDVQSSTFKYKLLQANTALMENDFTAYSNTLQGYQPQNRFDSSWLTVNEIYSHSWGRSHFSRIALDSTDRQTLRSIAAQPVSSGGDAVFTARIMLNWFPELHQTSIARLAEDFFEKREVDFVVYPNPVTDWVYFEGDPDVMSHQVNIIDLTGRISQKSQSEVIDGRHAVAMQGLTPGMYVIEVQTLSGTKRAKLLKN